MFSLISAQNTITLPTGLISNLKSIRVAQVHTKILTSGLHTIYIDITNFNNNYYYDGINDLKNRTWSMPLNGMQNQDLYYINTNNQNTDVSFLDGQQYETFDLNIYVVDNYNNISLLSDITQENRFSIELSFGDNGLI